MIHELDIKVIGAEQVAHVPDVFFRVVVLLIQQVFGQVAGNAGGQGDQALVVLADEIVVHAGAVIEPPRERLAHQGHQVPVARFVLAQQNQMAVFPGQGALVLHVGTHVYLAPDHGMNTGVLARLVKLHRAVQHAVVGDGAGVHAQLLHALDQLLDPARAVQQAVFRMQMQVREGHGRPSLLNLIFHK